MQMHFRFWSEKGRTKLVSTRAKFAHFEQIYPIREMASINAREHFRCKRSTAVEKIVLFALWKNIIRYDNEKSVVFLLFDMCQIVKDTDINYGFLTTVELAYS